jgi:hypothetical protein
LSESPRTPDGPFAPKKNFPEIFPKFFLPPRLVSSTVGRAELERLANAIADADQQASF